MPLRIGFVSARAASVEGDRIYTDAGLGRLIDALAAGSSRFTAALSVMPERHAMFDHRLQLSPSELVAMPPMPNFTKGVSKVVPCARAIAEVERRSDVVIVQLPFASPLSLVRPRGPRVYHVCMDQRAYLRISETYKHAARLASIATADAVDLLQRALVSSKRARVVTHGEELLERYGRDRGRAVVSSSILEREIMSVPRSRAADDDRFRVLFVGYLRAEKGIDVLVSAVERLVTRVPKAELVIVGARDAMGHGFEKVIERRLDELKSRCTFLGHKGFGPELFQWYADSDVVALPSRSEGTPRVLVEARAFGCPVVASRVGGIPTSVTDGVDGLLVPPGDVLALEQALYRVATDSALRAKLIAGGIERAKASTVERFAAALLEEAALAQA